MSLVLCMATAVLWVRSYFVADYIEVRKDWKFSAWSDVGTFRLSSSSIVVEMVNGQGAAIDSFGGPYSQRWDVAGRHAPKSTRRGLGLTTFGAGPWKSIISGRLNISVGARGYDLEFPHWVLVVALSIAPAIRVRKRRMVRRAVGEYCSACGYDLRATPDRCPECGTLVSKKSK